MKHEEDAIQRALFQWISLATPRIPQLALAFAVPNGMAADAKVRIDRKTGKTVRYSPTAARMKGLGLRPGVPDVMIPCPSPSTPVQHWSEMMNVSTEIKYTGLAIELKTKTGTVTAPQKEWHDRLREAGWQVNVCRSFDEARQVIADYFGVKP